MKKRKNIILSAFTCMLSICLLMFGVYAAINPSVSISGQVSYTARDAKVLVQGKVNGAKGQSATVDYPSATVTSNAVTATKVTDSNTQYLDFTAGTGVNGSDADLLPWTVGTLEFSEDNTGVKDITIGFKLTNLSTYPVKASITFGKTDAELLAANVKRVATASEAILAQNGGNQEVLVTYSVKDDSKSVTAKDLLNVNIVFQKAGPTAANAISVINENSGKVTMGKQSSSSAAEDVQWKCFAYSTDGTTWTKLAAGEIIPDNAKYGYFLLDDDKVIENCFLSSSKYKRSYNSSTGEEHYYHNETGLTSVYANDYYYSDVRQAALNVAETFGIDTDSALYKAIQARTISDLYSKMRNGWNSTSSNFEYQDVQIPTGTTGNEEDKFWLLSHQEASDYFDNIVSWTQNDYTFWLRTPSGDDHWAFLVNSNGEISDSYNDTTGDPCTIFDSVGVRPAFMLQFA